MSAIDPRDLGAAGDGVTDDTPAFLLAASLSEQTSRPLAIPAGHYRLTQPIPFNRVCAIRGAGPSLTRLIWDSGDGISFTSTNDDSDFLDVRDVSFRTKAVGGVALKANYSAQIIDGEHTMGRSANRFNLYNCFWLPDGPIDQMGWDIGFESIAALYGVIRDCNFFGQIGTATDNWPLPRPGTVGIFIHGTGDDGQFNGRPCAFVIDNANMMQLESAIVFKGCEGGFVKCSNLVGVVNGIVWDSVWTQRPQLIVANTHINSSAAGIIANDLADAQINNVLFYNFGTPSWPSTTGIILGGDLGCLSPNICQNTFGGTGPQMNAIVIGKGTKGVVANNCFRGSIATGVWLLPEAHGFLVRSNVFADVPSSFRVYDQGTGNVIQDV